MKKIQKIEIFSFNIPLKIPIKIQGITMKNRGGFLCRITFENKTVGIGEISPLYPLNKESLREVFSQIRVVARSLRNNIEIDWSKLFPSVSFGMKSALETIGENTILSIQYCSLFYHSFKKSSFLADAETYKIKIGQLSVEESIEMLCAFKRKFPKKKLRLDVNQRWTFSDAMKFLRNFQPSDFEFIEEPCYTKDDLIKILIQAEYPIAIDESLHTWTIEQLKEFSHLKAVVLKPTVVNYEKWIHSGIPLVFSSAFETGVGISHIAHLAKKFSSFPSGLDTYKYLSHDILLRPLKYVENILHIYPLQINERKLNLCAVV